MACRFLHEQQLNALAQKKIRMNEIHEIFFSCCVLISKHYVIPSQPQSSILIFIYYIIKKRTSILIGLRTMQAQTKGFALAEHTIQLGNIMKIRYYFQSPCSLQQRLIRNRLHRVMLPATPHTLIEV